MLQPQWSSQHYCILPSSSLDALTPTRSLRSFAITLLESCRKAVGRLFSHHLYGINWVIFFPIYKEAREKAYTIEIIKAAFKKSSSFSQSSKPTANSRRESWADTACILGYMYTPCTKYDLSVTQFALKYHSFT